MSFLDKGQYFRLDIWYVLCSLIKIKSAFFWTFGVCFHPRKKKKKKKKRYCSLTADAQRPISQRVTDTLSAGDPNPWIIKRDFLLVSVGNQRIQSRSSQFRAGSGNGTAMIITLVDRGSQGRAIIAHCQRLSGILSCCQRWSGIVRDSLLLPEVVRDCQGSLLLPEVVRDFLLLPEVVRDCQVFSLVARGSQGFSLVARGGQGFTETLSCCQRWSGIVRDSFLLPEVVRDSQRLSCCQRWSGIHRDSLLLPEVVRDFLSLPEIVGGSFLLPDRDC